jgi:hypothetical protein
MMQIRVMGHAGVMAGIHGSRLTLLSSFLRAGKKRKEHVSVREAIDTGKLNKKIMYIYPRK